MGNCISTVCPYPCVPICCEKPDEPEENFERNISKVHEEKKPHEKKPASGVIVGIEPEKDFEGNISKVHQENKPHEKKPLLASGVIVGIEPDSGKVCYGVETVQISRRTKEKKLKEKIPVYVYA